MPAPPRLPILIISFLFALDSERGHLYEYNKAVGEAARLAGWEPRAAVRAAARIADLPPGWELCLGSARTRLPAGPLATLEKGVRLCVSLAGYLRRTAAENRPAILFLEWFNFVHLLPLTVALASVRRREAFEIWVVHRLEAGHDSQSRANRFLLRCLAALVAGRLTHLSDSQIVAREMAQFGYAVHLLPIPHTALFAATGARAEAESVCVVAWLPGQATPEKGLDVVRQLVGRASAGAEWLEIVASESSRLSPTPGGCRIRLLPDVLPRSDYLAWMQRADVILLPYDPARFRARTSGIFVEAVVAGKAPLVTDGTWMAGELRQHGLGALILDWNGPTILGDLRRVARAEDLRLKLAAMQAAYADYHSVHGFALAMQRVWDETHR